MTPAAARLIRSGVPREFFAETPRNPYPKRVVSHGTNSPSNQVGDSTKMVPLTRFAAQQKHHRAEPGERTPARDEALATLRRTQDASRSAWGSRPDAFALGRAVAIAGQSYVPWLDHPRVLGTDPERWREFVRGLREVWEERRQV